jgi:4-amino-4-deoxy-L-arabinose transferase-like glycosyltransferase
MAGIRPIFQKVNAFLFQDARTSAEYFLNWLGLMGMLGIAIGLRFYNMASLGLSNHYYAASVVSMSQSWHNFFFAAAEPGGSVSVDKTPLGLWIQVLFASIFGVNNFGVLLPQLLAGVFSVLLVYHLVQRTYGSGAGYIAGMSLAVMPIVVATDRNNTMDSLLIFTLLLAAWMFIKATESNRFVYVSLGAILVGAGFNMKMWEAYLPLPAFYLLYMAGAAESVWRKLLKLVIATILLVSISFIWMAIVDLTPANQRPYVDNSGNNSEFGLALGYNGITRVFGAHTSGGRDGFPGTGYPGEQRLISPPLSKDIGWLLPMGFVGIFVLLFSTWITWPVAINHQTLILWGLWFLISCVFISFAGFIHEYYLTIIAAPLAVLTAVGINALWQLRKKLVWLSNLLVSISIGICIAFQTNIALKYLKLVPWLPVLYFLFSLGVVLLVGAGLIQSQRNKQPLSVSIKASTQPNVIQHSEISYPFALSGMICLCVSLLLTPGIWSGLTNLYPTPNLANPASYDGQTDQGPPVPSVLQVNPLLLAYLQKNTKGIKYLLAVPSSMQGSDYILASGRPVAYIGGFASQEQAITGDQLNEMIGRGELRFIYWGGGLEGAAIGKSNVTGWVISKCKRVPGYDEFTSISGAPDGTWNGGGAFVPGYFGGKLQMFLFDCWQ